MRVFYDLTCPFCYLAQPFNKDLLKAGATLIELPFQAHPDTPSSGGGTYIGPRSGPMYDFIAAQAKASHLPLHWRDRLPNSRLALAAAEWTRRNEKLKDGVAEGFREALFRAHFAERRDIGDKTTVLEVAKESGVDGDVRGLEGLEAAWEDGTAFRMVDEAERMGKQMGIRSTPSWESGGRVVSGLQSTAEIMGLWGGEKRKGEGKEGGGMM